MKLKDNTNYKKILFHPSQIDLANQEYLINPKLIKSFNFFQKYWKNQRMKKSLNIVIYKLN